MIDFQGVVNVLAISHMVLHGLKKVIDILNKIADEVTESKKQKGCS